MNKDLMFGAKINGEKMSIGIAYQEQQLKKEHACGPNSRATPEPWQDIPSDNRLYLKQEESAQKDGEPVRQEGGNVPRRFFHGMKRSHINLNV